MTNHEAAHSEFTLVRGVGVYVNDTSRIRDLFTVSKAAQEWDGHCCRWALAAHDNTYAPCVVKVTGWQVRTYRGVSRTDYRITVRLTFASDPHEEVLAELVYLNMPFITEVKQFFHGG